MMITKCWDGIFPIRLVAEVKSDKCFDSALPQMVAEMLCALSVNTMASSVIGFVDRQEVYGLLTNVGMWIFHKATRKKDKIQIFESRPYCLGRPKTGSLFLQLKQ